MAKRSKRHAKPAASLAPETAEMSSRESGWRLPDQVIEESLLTDKHAKYLETYLGEQLYQELRQLKRRAVASRTRGGQRVLILPGIMGSKLGRPSAIASIFDDVYWLDPLDIAMGYAQDLALGTGNPYIQPMGVFLFAYLKIKLLLQIDGYDASFYPFDWRKSISLLGQELADHIRTKESATSVSLVAHSMGGLVSRAALHAGAKKVKRLIMLGTPNYGSFAPVLAFRGVHETVKMIAALDQVHNTVELVNEVFSTFDGLAEMLPAARRYPKINFFDPASWPTSGPKVRADVLRRSAGIQDRLAQADDRFFLIAGVNQATVVDAQLKDGEFQYESSFEGDGTVPLAFARLEGAKTYYAEESHGSLPNNGSVIRAVGELLSTGRTDQLPDTPPALWRRPPVIFDDSSLRRQLPFRGLSRGELRSQDLREVLRDFVSPRSVAATVAAGPAVGEPATVPATSQRETWRRLSVGRIAQHRLEIHLARASITEVEARAYVLGMFREVTPTGAARAIDEMLEGAITEFTQRRMYSGNVGEVFILPASRRRLCTDMILFAGLGHFDGFTDQVQQVAAENVMRTFIRTRVEDFATVLFGAGSGRPTAQLLFNLMQGFIRAKLDCDNSRFFRRITICEIDQQRYEEICQEAYRLASTPLFKDVEVVFTEMAPEEIRRVIVEPSRQPVSPREDPAYLLVRQSQESKQQIEFQSSVLTSDAKAAIAVGTASINSVDLQAMIDRIESNDFKLPQLDQLGSDIAMKILPDSVYKILSRTQNQHLVVLHDAAASRLPWESMRIGDWRPAVVRGMSRRHMADNMSAAKYLESRLHGEVLRMLLVVNPTEDLDGAEEEGRRISDLFANNPAIALDTLRHAQATRRALLKAFESNLYDIVHYAGHAFFDATNRAQSGLVCAAGEHLTGADLTRVGNLPSLIVFNACESGRVRTTAKLKATKKLDVKSRIERNIGLAEAFLRGGVANYVGTFWPVGDSAAKLFAETFYPALLEGRTLGNALVTARNILRDTIKTIDWADYVHYGDFSFMLRRRST